MSRFIKPSFTSDNVYVEFRFENSLRKYESKPTKKVKGEHACNNCCAHHNVRKIITNSPVGRSNLHFSKGKAQPGQQKTVQNKSFGGLSEIHLVSSNKSIKLSKRKVLQDLNSNNNQLEKKIYASFLVNLEKNENKQSRDQEQVFLNDFQPSMDMDRQEDGEGDADFGKIEINQNYGAKNEDKVNEKQIQEQKVQDECNQIECSPAEKVQKQQQQNQIKQVVIQEEQKEQKINENYQVIEQDSISLRIENMKVAEELQQNQQHSVQQCHSPLKDNQNQIVEVHQIDQICQKGEEYIADEQEVQQIQQKSQQCQENPSLRSRPDEDSIISSKLIEQNQMSESMMQKCLAFQGGRIYIDSSGQNFYISVRVFNKLRKNCSRLEDLISTLISQRPYLQDKQQKLREEFEEYLRNQA